MGRKLIAGIIFLLVAVFNNFASCLLAEMEYSDVVAVRTRLEDEKAKRLLLQNDVEVLMLKIARLERELGATEDALPMMMARNIEQNENKIQVMSKVLDRLQETVAAGQGSVYTRWGRTECPGNGTEFIYKGYAGGSHFNQKGSAANTVCLPEDPTWNQFQDGTQSASARMSGVEYKFTDHNRMTFFGHELRNNDAPCVVCRAPRSTVLMIAGRNACYDGWNSEYSGFLVAGYRGHQAATEFICMDTEPEKILGGNGEDSSGRLWYFVEAACGILKCPPYVEGRELSCTVCTK